ncbi:hypothetical protein PWT90_05098 [Aphanocladium album]|nr:hypothetical protein PWT90_05098 [Aphanocladium album]
MKFAYTLLTVPLAALAAPGLMESAVRRDGDKSGDKAQQLLSGVAQAIACFDIALDKAGVTKSGAVVPTQPPGVDCEAIISLANAGGAKSSGASGSGTSSATSTSSSSGSAKPTSPSGSATGSSSASSTTSGPSSTGSMSSTGSSSTPSATSSK